MTRPARSRSVPAAAATGAVQALPARLDCFAAVAPGLESLAVAEAIAMELPATPEEGGFAWSGGVRSVLSAVLALRIASRVLVRIGSFEARTFAELERRARRLPWGTFVRVDGSARFRVTCRKSRLYHSDAVAERLAGALGRSVPGVRVASGSASEEAETELGASLFVVRFFRDRCTVSVDASGELLHRRGYRQATAKAPLRETLAAGLLAASGWDGVSPLVDPLCGSGTIPIEAALVARRIAPGSRRAFAVESWPSVPATLVRETRSAIAATALDAAPGAIVGTDRDAGAIESARGNATRAGVEDDVELAVRALSAMRLPNDACGWCVTNPPYGVRVGDVDRVRDLWARLGDVLRARAPGWRLALLSPDPALERQLRLPTRVVAQTTNGGIPVRIVTAQIPG